LKRLVYLQIYRYTRACTLGSRPTGPLAQFADWNLIASTSRHVAIRFFRQAVQDAHCRYQLIAHHADPS
jgi:hypothetical protein